MSVTMVVVHWSLHVGIALAYQWPFAITSPSDHHYSSDILYCWMCSGENLKSRRVLCLFRVFRHELQVRMSRKEDPEPVEMGLESTGRGLRSEALRKVS